MSSVSPRVLQVMMAVLRDRHPEVGLFLTVSHGRRNPPICLFLSGIAHYALPVGVCAQTP